MKNKLKIAVFTDSYLPGTGGTEMAIKNMCEGLENLGNEVMIYCPDYHIKKCQDAANIFRMPSLKLSKNDMAALPSLKRNRLAESIKKFNPDIIHFCTGSGMAKWATKIGEKFKIPVVGTIHTKFRASFSDSIHSKVIVNSMLKSIANKLRKCQSVSVVSYSQIADIHSYGYKGENIEIIKNGTFKKEKEEVTEQQLQETRTKYNLKDEFVFLFVGHLVKFKNIQFTLRALGMIKNSVVGEFSNFKFLIVGEGNYHKQLQKLANSLNLQDNVIFTGLIKDRALLNSIYNISDLLLFPSIFDNDTLVVCEAGSNNVPSLVLKGSGASERIADNVNGFESENSIEAFANRIVQILNNKTLYNKVRSNLDSILSKTWTEIAEEYVVFYKNAIEKYQKTGR